MENFMTTPDYLKRPSSGLVSKAFSDIVQKAYEFGATGVAIIPAKKIVVDYNLAARCKEPRCENYGLSKSCPPYVSGPTAFKNLLQTFQQVIFLLITIFFQPKLAGAAA
jgi:predicted metal-binding protein